VTAVVPIRRGVRTWLLAGADHRPTREPWPPACSRRSRGRAGHPGDPAPRRAGPGPPPARPRRL